MRERYGNVITENWLIIQINDFNSYIGVKEQSKNTVFQMAEMAKMICSRYFYLKLSEIMLFFFKLKVGDYGKMYGYVDPMAIMESLRYFLRYRAEILDEMDREQRHKEQELWKKTAINREQWEEIKKARAIMGNNAPNLSSNAIKQLAR